MQGGGGGGAGNGEDRYGDGQQQQQQQELQLQQGAWAGEANNWQASDGHVAHHQVGYAHHYTPEQHQQQQMYLSAGSPQRADAHGSPYLAHEPLQHADVSTPESKPAFAMSAEVLSALEVVDRAMSSGGGSSSGCRSNSSAGDHSREGLRFRVLDGALAGLVNCLDDGLAVWDSFIQLGASRGAESKEQGLDGDETVVFHVDSFRSRGSAGSFMTAEEASLRDGRRLSSGSGGEGGRGASFGSETGSEESVQYGGQWGDSDAFTDATTEIAGFSESDEGCDSMRATDDEMTSSLSEVTDGYGNK